MAKKKDFDAWLIGGVCIGLGVLFLYQRRTGWGTENDAALIPNALEDKIDVVITALNNRFGKAWVEYGMQAIEGYARNALPAALVALIAIVVEVENSSKRRFMTGFDKQQRAAQIARERGLS